MVTAKVLPACAALGICVGLFATPGDVAADTIVFDLTEKIDKDNPVTPVGGLKATFSDAGTNVVDLTLSFSSLDLDQKAFRWYFNFTGDVSTLSFDHFGGVLHDSVALDPNSHKADGDGYFDILLTFPADNEDAFNAGESSTFRITSSTSFNVYSFNDGSASGPGSKSTYYAGVHVGAVPDEAGSSVWMGDPDGVAIVPLPAAAWGGLLLFGGIGAHRLRRRRA